jgi:hypothetical protein
VSYCLHINIKQSSYLVYISTAAFKIVVNSVYRFWFASEKRLELSNGELFNVFLILMRLIKPTMRPENGQTWTSARRHQIRTGTKEELRGIAEETCRRLHWVRN